MKNHTLDLRTNPIPSKWILALPACFAAACAVEPAVEATTDAAPLKHCAVGPHGETTCYATFTEAIAHATSGRITDAPAGRDDSFDIEAFTERVNGLENARIAQAAAGTPGASALTVLVGIVYKSPNFDLDEQTWNFYLPDQGCDGFTNTIELQVPNLNTSPYTVSDINDQISSFRAFSGCGMVLYWDWFYQGPATNFGLPATQMANLGPMQDRASSIRWF